MREYKIYKTSLGYSIYRRKENGKLICVEFLCGNNRWSLNKKYARTFYNEDDAISALTICKTQGGGKLEWH